jgi:alpha-glucosidase
MLKLEIGETPEGLQLRLSGPRNLHLTIDADGFILNNGANLSGRVISRLKIKKVNNQWNPVYGERNVIPDRYREAVITLVDKNGATGRMEVICRVYDEGVAFRYCFPDTLPKGANLQKELTAFRFEGNYAAWASGRAQSKIEMTTLNRLTQEVERPLLIKANDSWLALGEAALVDFARMKLLADPQRPHTLIVQLSGEVNLDQTGHISPWRYVMVADTPGKLLENNYFIQNLNEPCPIQDVSWIKPGKVIREVTLTTQGGLACVDFAAKNGVEYVEFDAGWYGPENNPLSDATAVNVDPQRSPGPLDLQKIIGYAKEKNVGIILYVNHHALERQLDTILPLYRSWGIKGVKYGFVNVGSQLWTSWLHEAVRKAAANRLMVDIHDEYRPTGYSRTWPNLMTQEGIRGDEESPSTEHTLNTLFTRMIAGAGDNTNCYFAPRVPGTMGGKAAQLAKAIMLYSPWQFIFWYDRPEGSPVKKGGAGNNESVIKEVPELPFFKALPTVWDETRVVEGEIGRYATIVRRSGDTWFVGSLTAIQDRTVNIPLHFLGKKFTYEAVLYVQNQESLTKNEVMVKRLTVNSATVISEKLLANSGLAIMITKVKSSTDK